MGVLLFLVAGAAHAGAAEAVPQTLPGDPDGTPAADPPVEETVFPERTYDPGVPAPSAYLGYGLGEHLADHKKITGYLERLAETSDRVIFETHGTSYEGRGIHHVVLSSPDNLARLEEIRANLARLADPRTLGDDGDLEAIVRETPPVVMLNFATDGAETAGPESALHVAYQLAAGTDERTEGMLDDAVVVVIPAENPDSNHRVVAWYNAFRVGPEGTADPAADEHHFPWGFNSNNRYQIDMNRESVWSTQRETRAMVELYHQWNPQVFVDNHGQHPAYTGPWYSEPLHEQLTDGQRDWLRRFGESMAEAFAEHGYRYRAWEFGQFDPGYWDTYPNFTGAIAWTTETTGGGNRGLRMQMPDGGPLFTLEDGIIQHMIASDLTVTYAAENREELLRHFQEYRQTAVEEGGGGDRAAYVLSADNDPERLATVVATLRRNRIDVHRTTEEVALPRARPHFRSGGDGTRAVGEATVPPGSYVVPLTQPQGRLATILLEPEARFSEEFLAQIDDARAVSEERGWAERIFYDITAWSMPLTYHLQAYEVADPVPDGAVERVEADPSPESRVVNADARHGYVIDYGSNAAIRAMTAFSEEDLLFRVASEPFRIDGRDFRSGTVAVFHRENADRDLRPIVEELAEDAGLTVVGVDGPVTEEGPHLGSHRLSPVPPARVAVVMDRPVAANSYGHIWYTFERRYGLDFTALNFDRLLEIDLNAYDVLILPDGDYGSVHDAVGAEVAERLRRWVETGGTLIGIREASAWLARDDFGITSARVRRPEEGSRGDLPIAPGTIFRAAIRDPGHPLAFGYDGKEEIPVMVWSRLALEREGATEAPVRIAEGERAPVSGFAFPESVDYLEGSPYVVRERPGDGAVVLFLDDPNFRLFWDGLTRMFFNAVFLARTF